MKTFLKLLGFALVGVGALVLLLMLFGVITWALHLVIPILVLAAIGFVAWKLFAGKAPPAQALPPAQAEERLADKKTEPSKTLSAEEAARQFEALKKGP